jgi:WD40 repeat protein
VTNWGDGFLVARQNTSTLCYYRFEDQKYVSKFEYEVSDKENRIVAVDANEDRVLVLLSNALMLGGRLKYESSKEQLKFTLEPVNLHFHSAPIVGMDVCVRKPLIATASKDKTSKIWNYEERTVETPKS